jgi:hypothetical protein
VVKLLLEKGFTKDLLDVLFGDIVLGRGVEGASDTGGVMGSEAMPSTEG